MNISGGAPALITLSIPSVCQLPASPPGRGDQGNLGVLHHLSDQRGLAALWDLVLHRHPTRTESNTAWQSHKADAKLHPHRSQRQCPAHALGTSSAGQRLPIPAGFPGDFTGGKGISATKGQYSQLGQADRLDPAGR